MLQAEILSHDTNVVQQLHNINGYPVRANGDVYCPMCEAYHINNTMCQMPAWSQE